MKKNILLTITTLLTVFAIGVMDSNAPAGTAMLIVALMFGYWYSLPEKAKKVIKFIQ